METLLIIGIIILILEMAVVMRRLLNIERNQGIANDNFNRYMATLTMDKFKEIEKRAKKGDESAKALLIYVDELNRLSEARVQQARGV